MVTVSGWETLLLTVRVTADGWEVRVGGFFVLILVWLAYRVLGWIDDEPGTKTAT